VRKMRRLALWTIATVVLSGSLWGQGQGAPTGQDGPAVNAGKKTPEGKGGHHHHHHKHHHKKS
jgi:H+/Cl- antiporter ClcA